MKQNLLKLIALLIFLNFSCDSKIRKEKNISKYVTISFDKLSSKLKNEAAESIKIASWNIRDLGRTKNTNEIIKISKIIRNFDIVAIQEVVGKDPAGAQAVARIANELNRLGSKWDYQVSNPTKSPSAYISERYAFLWKTSKLKLSKPPFLDSELESKCYREPYIANFKIKKDDKSFYVVNFHSRKFNDHPEIEIIHLSNYPTRLKTNNIIILGDFNLIQKHKVWKNFYELGFKPALNNIKTTLKTKCKNANYLNYQIDNILYTQNFVNINSKAIDFVGACDNLNEARQLSDHLPIYMEFLIK